MMPKIKVNVVDAWRGLSRLSGEDVEDAQYVRDSELEYADVQIENP